MSTAATAPATSTPQARTAGMLSSVSRSAVRGVVGVITLFALVAFVFFASQQVGYGEADVSAMFAVGAIGFSVLAGLAVLIGVIIGAFKRWTGWVGLALLITGFVLTILLFTAWGGTFGTVGMGWYGLVIGALFLITTLTIILPVRRQ